MIMSGGGPVAEANVGGLRRIFYAAWGWVASLAL